MIVGLPFAPAQKQPRADPQEIKKKTKGSLRKSLLSSGLGAKETRNTLCCRASR